MNQTFCKECGEQFITKFHRSKLYCSNKCRMKAYNKQLNISDKILSTSTAGALGELADSKQVSLLYFRKRLWLLLK